jgi:hypothetical protein
VHATVRQYEGIENPAELIRQVGETFLPLMQAIPGYVSYYFVDVGEAGGRMVSVSVFQTEEGTTESNRQAAAWVAEHPNLIPPAKSAEAGPVVVGD